MTSGSKYTTEFVKLRAVWPGVFPCDANIMTALKGSQHWPGSLFLMICENRIFTYVWGGVGEACVASR